MDDPDPEPSADGPPRWAFYSLWPRIAEADVVPAERRCEVERSVGNSRWEAVMS